MAIYLTKEGDTVDYIAYKYYGNTNNRIVEKILELNIGLSEYSVSLPAGISVNLPEQTTAIVANRKIKLWD